MKQLYILLFIIFSSSTVSSQIGFQQHSVSVESGYGEVALASDLTGNGHLDLVYTTTSAASGDSIKYVINTDGEGGFTFPYYISSLGSAFDLHAADLDGDNDLDIISARFLEDRVAWHRNSYNGLLYFDNDTEDIITESANAPTSVFAADLDGDNDLDILVASAYDDTIAWYENTDGYGNFGPEQIISNVPNSPQYISSADIDNDGDMDVVVASSNDDSLRWYRNTDGLGNFELGQTVTTFADTAVDADLADIDGDGDLDLLSASRSDDKLAWYENTDGNGTFGAQQIIDTSIDFVKQVATGDIDNDGDLDVIASSGSFGGTNPTAELVWFENIDGLGTFGTKQAISTSGHGAHSLVVKDVNEDGLLDVVFVSSSAFGWFENLGISTNEIRGNVRLDSNFNGCFSSDVPVPNLLITTTNGTETFSTLSLNNSLYQLFPDQGNYTTTIGSQLPNYFNSFPSSHNSSFVGYGTTETADFCLQASGIVDDLSVSLYPLFAHPRPGFNVTYQFVYRNNGTTVQNGNLSLVFDDTKLQYVNANENVTLDSNNTLNFSYSNLNPFEIRIINFSFYVYTIPTTNIDDVLNFTATVNPISGDATVEDNEFILEDVVFGAYDPNDIQVLEGDEVHIDDSDKYLHYIIRFQNTGTAEAINVNVENILDSKLDLTTLQLESLSHDGRVEITNGSQINFIFDDINLPDSTNDEPNSHGYITYKIKPLNTVQIGDIINNTADIFFDFNPAITTNTVSTEFVDQLSVSEYELSSFSVFPNPTTGLLNLTSKTEVNAVNVLDINGRLLKELQFRSPTFNTKIDLSNLSKGIYFLNIKSIQGSNTIKIVKK